MEPQSQIRGHLAAFITISLWGLTFISNKLLLVSFTPVEIMFYRLILAVAAMFILSPPQLTCYKQNPQWLQNEWRIAAAGLCGVTLYYLFQNIALSYNLAANVSVLVSVAPLFTALGSRLFLDEKLKANFFIGFTLAMAGIILIAFNGSVVLKLNPLGDLLSILAALAWAIYCILIKRVSGIENSGFALTRKVFFYGFLFMLPVLPFFGVRLDWGSLLALPNLLNLLFLSVVASAGCFIGWNYAVRTLGPVKTSVYLYLVPVVTIVASALVLCERLTLAAGIGMAFILVGMVLSERDKTT